MKQTDILNNSTELATKASKQVHHFTLFVDGASRHNPGHSAAGIYLLKDSNVIYKQGFYLGIKTNNQAEYLAFVLGLFLISDYYQRGDTVRIISDSKLLVMQVNNKYKINNAHLKPLHALAQKMMHTYNAHVLHVLRAENTHADTMANQGLDKRTPLPSTFVELLHRHKITI